MTLPSPLPAPPGPPPHATASELHHAGSVALPTDASRLPPSLAHHVANTAALRAQLPAPPTPVLIAPAAAATPFAKAPFSNPADHAAHFAMPLNLALNTVRQLQPCTSGLTGGTGAAEHSGSSADCGSGSCGQSLFQAGSSAPLGPRVSVVSSHGATNSTSHCSWASKQPYHAHVTKAAPTETFLDTLTTELSRLRRLLTCSLEGLWWRADRGAERLQRAFAALQHARQAGQQQQEEEAAGLAAVCAELRAECDSIGSQLIDLEAFECFNSAELSSLALEYDMSMVSPYGSEAATASTASPCPVLGAMAAAVSGDRLAALEAKREYHQAVQRYVLGGLTYDMVLVAMSDLYDAVRQAEEAASSQGQAAGPEEAWVPPDEFKRSTTKFWVDPRDVLRVKAAIVRHLPVLIFGRRQPTLAEYNKGERSFSDEDAAATLSLPHLFRELADGAPISSVYMDTPELAVYHDRLARNDGASLVRVRWYGPAPGPDDSVYVERKVHREKWTGERSTKDRATLPARDVPSFLAGRAVPALAPLAVQQDPAQPQPGGKALRAAALLADVQRDLVDRKQAPHVRTVYRRTAFQLSSTNAVRISIDSHMSLVREAGAPRRQGGWCRDMSQPVHRDDVIHFPYAVLEIKLEDEEAEPEWVTSLRSSGLLVPAGKFSKFSHGMALLFPQRVQRTPEWFAEEEAGPGAGGLSPVTLQEMAIVMGAREANREQQRKEEVVAAVVREPDQLHRQQQAAGPPVPLAPHLTGAATVSVWPSLPEGPPGKAQEHHVSFGQGENSWRPWLAAKWESLRQWHSPSSHAAGKGDVEAGGKGGAAANTLLPRGGIMPRARIEPKTFFAAERTFLAWLQIAVLIMLTALSLLASGGGGAALAGVPGVPAAGGTEASSCPPGSACRATKVAGMAMAPVALAFMLYALWMYRRRSAQMLQRQAVRYDDQWGPVLLTVTLIGVLVTAYVLAIKAA